MGRVRVPTRTRGTHSSAREMGPVSESEEDGANATMSIAGHITGMTRLQACSRQVLAMTRSLNPNKGTESPVTSYVTPAKKPTRGTQGKQGHAQYQ